MRVFAEHIQRVGKGLNTATGAYNDAIGSLERNMLPKARRIQELGAGDKTELPELEPLDTTPRQLSLPELPAASGDSDEWRGLAVYQIADHGLLRLVLGAVLQFGQRLRFLVIERRRRLAA